jgi:hypothetical protein
MSYLEMAKECERQILGYRAALWRWWEMTAAGADADEAEVTTVYDEIIRRIDELGPTSAARLRHAWAVEWFKETGCCPRCGERGAQHR